MHPAAAICFATYMMYNPWTPFFVAPYVAMEMWRLMLKGND